MRRYRRNEHHHYYAEVPNIQPANAPYNGTYVNSYAGADPSQQSLPPKDNNYYGTTNNTMYAASYTDYVYVDNNNNAINNNDMQNMQNMASAPPLDQSQTKYV